MLVMLRNDWPGDTFRRAGLEFQRAVPIDVETDTLKKLTGDLGKALVLVSTTTAKADHDATAEAAADLDAFLSKTAAPAVAVNDAALPDGETSETATTTDAAAPASTSKRKR